MKTLAESWADRLAELRAVCRENGERLDRVLRSWYERAHRDAWWSEFYYAATDGRELPPKVWRSAERLAIAHRRGNIVARLRTINEIRSSAARSVPMKVV